MNQIYEQYSQDPDETFKMYVDRLMKAQPRFGGAFATPQQQGQDATSKATGGLLTGLFPEYADRMGGGGGDSYMPSVNSGSAPSRGPTTYATAEDVARAKSVSDFFAGPGQLARVAGPMGMLIAGAGTGLSKMYYNDRLNSFNQGQYVRTYDTPDMMGPSLPGLDSDYYAETYNTPNMVGPMAPSAGGGVVGGQSGVGIDSGNFDSGGGGFTDMGGGVVGGDQTGYDGNW
jgi:hypothetical protein